MTRRFSANALYDFDFHTVDHVVEIEPGVVAFLILLAAAVEDLEDLPVRKSISGSGTPRKFDLCTDWLHLYNIALNVLGRRLSLPHECVDVVAVAAQAHALHGEHSEDAARMLRFFLLALGPVWKSTSVSGIR